MSIRRGLVWAVLVAALAAVAVWWFVRQQSAAAPVYRSAAVERGTVVASVAASGTLAPTVQVQVGSQVSGQILEVLADFNDRVTRGQVIARLDPQSIEYRVRQSQADVEAAQAQVAVQQATVAARRADRSRATVNLQEAQRDFERKSQLVERNFISSAERDRAAAIVRTVEQDLASAQAQLELAESLVRNAQATVRQREAQLAQSRIDLDRTVIRAPVDGVVIKRSIQPGQTVAASLQAPELFVIAQDLRDMQVDVSVDESEVSRIAEGQRATFTVDAFPGRSFEGQVRQVRKAAQSVQNVITYTVVVATTNERQSLLPGMTASVRIITDVRENVLRVPNAALRFRPPGWVEPSAAAPATSPGPPPGAAPAPGSVPGPGTSTSTSTSTSPGLAATGSDARPAAAQAGTAGNAGGAAAAPGRAQAAFRERLERELELTEPQRTQLAAIYAGQREAFMRLREAPESERARLAERQRSDLQARIRDILDEPQRERYARILAEVSGRSVTRGRVFVAGPDGKPRALELRLGLSDGAATEVLAVTSGGTLEAADRVLIGLASGPAGTGGSGAARPASGPRFGL